MRQKNQIEPSWQPDEELRKSQPPGVKLVRTLRGHTGHLDRIAWSPDGRILASPSEDETVRLWNAETGECVHTLKGHEVGVNCVAFDPTGHILASRDRDGKVKLWNVASGKLLRTINVGRHVQLAYANLAFDSTGKGLVTSGAPVTLWDVASGKPLLKYNLRSYCIALDPTRRTLASEDGISEVSTGKLLTPIEGMKETFIAFIAFDPAGKLLVSGNGSEILVWDSASGKLLRRLEGHTSVVDWAEFSSDGLLLGSKSNDDTFRLWRCDTWASVAVVPELNHHERPVRGLAFHPHLSLLATVGSAPRSQQHTCDR